MYIKVIFTFWITLALYITTLYAGVNLTYIALPIIIISGLIMIFSSPNEEMKEVEKNEELVLSNEEIKESTNVNTKEILEVAKSTVNIMKEVSTDIFEEISGSIKRGTLNNEIIRPLKKQLSTLDLLEAECSFDNEIEYISLIQRKKKDLEYKIKEFEKEFDRDFAELVITESSEKVIKSKFMSRTISFLGKINESLEEIKDVNLMRKPLRNKKIELQSLQIKYMLDNKFDLMKEVELEQKELSLEIKKIEKLVLIRKSQSQNN